MKLKIKVLIERNGNSIYEKEYFYNTVNPLPEIDEAAASFRYIYRELKRDFEHDYQNSKGI